MSVEEQSSNKAHQTQMQTYAAGCQHFFEKTLIDLVLLQPTDPHGFLLDALNKMGPEERVQWVTKMGGITTSGERPPSRAIANGSSPPIPTDQTQVQVVLKLVLHQDAKIRKRAIQVLEDLRRNGKAMPGCLHFEIYTGEDDDVLLLQTWATSEALDDYHAAPFFVAASGKFSGLLVDQPSFRVYSHHRAL